MPSLKASSIVKVDRFEVARCSSMYKITDHLFLIRFISPTIIDEVITDALVRFGGQISEPSTEATRILQRGHFDSTTTSSPLPKIAQPHEMDHNPSNPTFFAHIPNFLNTQPSSLGDQRTERD
ncbi:hypothetical protein YC2023_075672 [Brassica napus]